VSISRHHNYAHLEAPFGAGGFGKIAEKFARAFGTPGFIVGQTFVVAIWIALNALAIVHKWDPYPFILLNLCFSTQAAYAAPLILLAQTRQADRDKAAIAADAAHREEIAQRHCALIEANTALTEQVHSLATQVRDMVKNQVVPVTITPGPQQRGRRHPPAGE
jgi:uncharacterized membrane protein